MKTFEFDGEKYKKSSNHQKEWGDKIINELNIKENFKTITILDHIALLKKIGFKHCEIFWVSQMQAGFYAIK